MPFCDCLFLPESKMETVQRYLMVALPFLHREQVLGKSLRIHTLRRNVHLSNSFPWMEKQASQSYFSTSGAGRLLSCWLAQCWKRGELMWGW